MDTTPTGRDLRRLRHQVYPCIGTRELGPLTGLGHAVLVAIEGGRVLLEPELAKEVARIINELAARKLASGDAKPRKRAHWQQERYRDGTPI